MLYRFTKELAPVVGALCCVSIPLLAQSTCKRTSGGSLNGQPVDAKQHTVTVLPGALLQGTVVVATYSQHGNAAVVPLAATTNWGSPASQFWTPNPDIPDGQGTYNIPVHLTAPTKNGVYYLVIGFAPRYTGAQVMSATSAGFGPSTAFWGDGNDIAFDWSAQQFVQALSNAGTVVVSLRVPPQNPATFRPDAEAFTAVRVIVDGGSCKRAPGGILNGQPVDATNHTILVEPGKSITGTVYVDTDNQFGNAAVAPLAGTPAWGVRSIQSWTIASSLGVGQQRTAVPIQLTAPTNAGEFYIVIGFGSRKTAAQVMSGTSSGFGPTTALWGDGNDVGFDWTLEQLAAALSNKGSVVVDLRIPPLTPPTFRTNEEPFTAIRVLTCAHHYGASTSHCNGAPELSLGGLPKDGNASFSIGVRNAVPSGTGVMMISMFDSTATYSCVNSNRSMAFNVLPAPFSPVWILDPVGISTTGEGAWKLPLPGGLVGVRAYFQFYQNHLGTTCPCMIAAGIGGSASRALRVTIY